MERGVDLAAKRNSKVNKESNSYRIVREMKEDRLYCELYTSRYSPDTKIPTVPAHKARHLRLVPVRHCEAPEIMCDASAEVEN